MTAKRKATTRKATTAKAAVKAATAETAGEAGNLNLERSPTSILTTTRKRRGHGKSKPFSSAHQTKFLAAYSALGLIGGAARAAGISRNAHYWWLANDKDYPPKFEAAQQEANESLEREARRRAVEGTVRLKFYKGKPIIDPRTGKPYVEREYSDRMLEIALKAHMPEKYTERQKIETSQVQPPDEFDPEKLAALRQAGLVFHEQREGEANHGDNGSDGTVTTAD